MPDKTAQPPTLRDVARASGLSLATLDRVLNNRPGVRASTIAAARAAMASLGYSPNQAAANLARGRAPDVAVHIPTSAPALQSYLARCCENAPGIAAVSTEGTDLSSLENYEYVIDITRSSSRWRIDLHNRATGLVQDLSLRLAGDTGRHAAEQFGPLSRALDAPVAILRSGNPDIHERACITAFVQQVGSSIEQVNVVSDLSLLDAAGLVFWTRAPTAKEHAQLRRRSHRILHMIGGLCEQTLLAIADGAMDAAILLDVPKVSTALRLHASAIDPVTELGSLTRADWAFA